MVRTSWSKTDGRRGGINGSHQITWQRVWPALVRGGEYPPRYVDKGIMEDRTGLYLAKKVGERVAQRAKELQKIIKG